MFSEIMSHANFEAAYLEIIEQFAVDRRNYKYHGIDNIFLRDLDLKSKKIIKMARAELLEKKEIEPALSVKIPKANRPEEYREIFIYNLRERIKAQAIYRVVLPVFEKIFSDRLFSYRPDKPPYLAARIFCRRYRREFRRDQALIVDLKNYSDKINRELMFSQVKGVITDKKVLDILRLFIFNKVYRNGLCELPAVGLVQGVPLIALFANLYLTDLDFKYKAQADFYIRVGDDIAILDPDPDKLAKILEEISGDVAARGLEMNRKKLFLGPAAGRYSFLGYAFDSGMISLDPGFVRKIKLDWQKILTYKNLPKISKMKILERIMKRPAKNFNFQFQKIIKDKSQVNDSTQIRKMSENFFSILTRFVYKSYTVRNRRLLERDLKELELVSLYKTYKDFHYDRR